MVITSQTNESIKESKHYDNEDAICVPSEKIAQSDYTDKRILWNSKKESKVPQISLIPHVLLKTSPAESWREKKHTKGPTI